MWLLLMTGVVVLFLRMSLPAFAKNCALDSQRRALVQDIAKASKQRKDLRHELEALEKDPYYLERVMRRKLGMTREGEKVIKHKGLQP